MKVSAEWVGAIAGIASALAAFGSLGIIWGLNRLNRSYLLKATEAAKEAIESARRQSRGDAIADAKVVRKQINDLSRRVAKAEQQLHATAAIQVAPIDYSALQEAVIDLKQDIDVRFTALTTKAAELYKDCSQAVYAMISYRTESLMLDGRKPDEKKVGDAFVKVQAAFYAMEQELDGILSGILSR